MKNESAALVPLVRLGRDYRVDTRIIAKACRVTHQAILKLLETHKALIEKRFGTFGFEIQKSGGRPTRFSLLSEDQATFLITLLKNTNPVISFKADPVAAFRKVKEKLRQSDDIDLLRISSRRIAHYCHVHHNTVIAWVRRQERTIREYFGGVRVTKEAENVSIMGQYEVSLNRLQAVIVVQALPYSKEVAEFAQRLARDFEGVCREPIPENETAAMPVIELSCMKAFLEQ